MPQDRAPSMPRTVVVALAPVVASALALTVMLVISRAVEAADQPAPSGVIDLGPLVGMLVIGGGAGTLVWLLGLGLVVGTLFPAGRRAPTWWLLVGSGAAALLAGGWVLPRLLPVSLLIGGWLVQQVVLAVVAVREDRRIARPAPAATPLPDPAA